MSTTAAVGYIDNNNEPKAIGIRNDGYPDHMFNHLIGWLLHNGADQFRKAIDNSKGVGGMVFNDDYTPQTIVKEKANKGHFITNLRELQNYDWAYLVTPDGFIQVYEDGEKKMSVEWELNDEEKQKMTKTVFEGKFDTSTNWRLLIDVVKGI